VTRAWVLLFVALGLSAAKAQTAMYAVGAGRLSCGYWLSSPEHEADGRSWALGFWTAYNAVNEASHMVGAKADTDAIFGEVKKICVAEPSLGLVDAVVRVYVRFLQDGV
jgi:hypothetical protein